jgi:hypothetical protein
MHRVPNPPKLPVIAAADTRSRGGLRGAKGRLGAILLALLASCPTYTAEVLANEPAAPESPADRSAETVAKPASSGNIVVVGASASRAAIIREHAETIRREAFSQLLGETHPKPWLVRCEIRVHASADSFEEAVGGSPAEARGATSLEFAGDRVVARRIDVMGDGPAIVPDAIDHELVHVVLADHFVHAPPPRWADEGLALLFDSLEKQKGHEADFQDAHRRGLSWSAVELVNLEDYPADSGRQRIFYGQSAALVRWLIARRDAATFVRFLDDASNVGMEAALDRHYAINSLVSVSSAWKEVAPINTLGLSERRR